MLKQVPAGNILLSASILFSGSLPTKVLRLLKIYGCASISKNTYFRHQGHVLQPCIFTVWNDHQTKLFKELRLEKRTLVLGGDGRADSPGHSAKFGSYTVMELKKKAVIDIQLVQVHIKTIICMHIISNNSLILKRVTKLKGVTIWKKKDLSEH